MMILVRAWPKMEGLSGGQLSFRLLPVASPLSTREMWMSAVRSWVLVSLEKGASRSAEMSLHAHFDPFPSPPSLYQTPCRVPAQDRMQSSSVRPQRLTSWDEVVERGTPGEADCSSPRSPL